MATKKKQKPGPKPRGEGPRWQYTINCTQAEGEALRRHAEKRGISLAMLIRQALRIAGLLKKQRP